MSKGLISIFALPHEIDTLHLTLYNLRRNATFLNTTAEFGFDITLCLSDELTNWDASKLPKEYFEEKFRQTVNTLCGWAQHEHIHVEHGTNILGCVTQRKHSLKYIDSYDYTLWLDTDIFFNDKLLAYINSSTDVLKENSVDYYVLTPQITRQWDNTWDVLVNSQLITRPLHDYKTVDMFHLGLSDFGDVSLKQIDTFKAAGGWGTVMSNKLLKLTGIPDSFGHYGLEDTYVLFCAMILHQYPDTIKPVQFVLENFIVGENHSQQTTQYLKDFIHSIDRKDEFRNIAHQHFTQELQRFQEKVNNGYARVQL